MLEQPVGHVARLGEDELEDLERRLAIARSRLLGNAPRHIRGIETEPQKETPEHRELKQITSEIFESARRGVKIAPQTETRPLIPLFKAAKIDLPPELKVDHEQLHYVFYTVEVIFSILLPKDQFALLAELELGLTDDAQVSARRTRPIRLFPGRKDIQLFSVDLEGAIGIDASMNISTMMLGPQNPLLPFGEAAANARIKAGLLVGPLHFPFRKAAVEVQGEGDQQIFWRYNLQSEIAGANEFKSVLILKVAEEVRSVQIEALLRVTPCKKRWLLFKDVLPLLPDRLTLPVEIVPGRK